MLLVVFPGAVGRKPVLSQIQTYSQICVLVSQCDKERCAWAKELVKPDYWIEVPIHDHTTDRDRTLIWDKVTQWMEHTGKKIEGVLCYDEFGVEISAMLCEQLGVPGTPLETVMAVRSKYLMRRRCKECGIRSVGHVLLSNEQDLEAFVCREKEEALFSFPSVLKPTKGAGSWHVHRVDTLGDLTMIWKRLQTDLSASAFPVDVRMAGFVLEEYIEGWEVDVDGWAVDGKLGFMLVSDNRAAIEPYFLEVGGIYPSQLSEECLIELRKLTIQMLDAFPRVHGCFHFEAKIDPNHPGSAIPIELNLRTGGAECPASVAAVTGYYLPDVAARLALGQEPSRSETIPRYSCVATTNIHINKSGTLIDCSDTLVDVVSTNLITSVLFKESVGKPYRPNNGSKSCLGWLATGGCNVEEAESNLRIAISQLCIKVEP